MPAHFDRFRLLNDSDQDIDDVVITGTQPVGGTTLPTGLGRIGAGCGPRVFKGIKPAPGSNGHSNHASLTYVRAGIPVTVDLPAPGGLSFGILEARLYKNGLNYEVVAVGYDNNEVPFALTAPQPG